MLMAFKMAMLMGMMAGGGPGIGDGGQPVGEVAEARRPAFSLGAGDALGVQIRVNDEILARRLGFERVWFAEAGTPE